jgi:hypothetical protein
MPGVLDPGGEGYALCCALAGQKDPGGWQGTFPSSGFAKRVTGSSNKPVVSLATAYYFGSQQEMAEADALWQEYLDAQASAYFLKEPGSSTYGGTIVGGIIAAILKLNGRDKELADGLRAVVDQWIALAHLLAAPAKGYRVSVAMAGCRSWGHGNNEGSTLHIYYRVAAGLESPASGWKDLKNWTNHPGFVAELRASFARVKADPWAFVKFNPMVPFQYLGWEDGSRMSILGDCNPADGDVFDGISTPGFYASCNFGGVWKTYPEWPNPLDGDERIRMQNVNAHMEGEPVAGWTLKHNLIGPKPVMPDGRLWTKIAPHPGKLSFWKLHDRDGLTDLLKPEVPPEPVPVPGPSPIVNTGGQGRSGIHKSAGIYGWRFGDPLPFKP